MKGLVGDMLFKNVVCSLLCLTAVCCAQFPGFRRPENRESADALAQKREMAHLFADMRVLQEDMRILVTRIVNLEQENAAKDALIRELQGRINGYERRFQQLDQDLRGTEERLLTGMARGQEGTLNSANAAAQKGLDSLKNMIIRELSRIEGIAVRAANTASRSVPQAVPTGEWKEIRVQAGDTLSSIATQAGVSLRSLRQCNGLKNDLIRVGQLLKIPVTQK